MPRAPGERDAGRVKARSGHAGTNNRAGILEIGEEKVHGGGETEPRELPDGARTGPDGERWEKRERHERPHSAQSACRVPEGVFPIDNTRVRNECVLR